jgi:P27 family predicted phage terminase small subunit
LAAPKPRPPQLKLLNGKRPGTDSGGRRVKPAPAFVRKAPAPPTWLSAEAKAEWRRVVPQLERLNLLKLEDRAALATYCETWARFVQATRMIQSEGLTIRANQGLLAHPAVAIARTAGRELRAWCAEFGFTPSAEGRLNVQGTADAEEDFD